MKSIRDACHRYNDGFEFLPSFGFSVLGRFIGKGYILGKDYGVTVATSESMSVKLAFKLDAGRLPGFPTVLRFFHCANADADSTLRKSVLVDGDEKKSEQLDANSTPQCWIIELSDLAVGDHQVEFRLQASAASGFHTAYWRIWGISIQDPTLSTSSAAVTLDYHEISYTDTFEKKALNSLYLPKESDCWFILADTEITNIDKRIPDTCSDAQAQLEKAGITDSGATGYVLTRLVAAPNEQYLITDIVDGILPYMSTTDSTGEDDALDPEGHYGLLLEALARELGSVKLLPMCWGLPIRFQKEDGSSIEIPVDPDVLVERLKLAQEWGEGSIVWNYPLPLQFMNAPDKRGLFAESAVIKEYADVGYGIMAQWPGRQNSIRGWYQRWIYDYTGPIEETITVKDNREAVLSLEGSLTKRIDGLYESDVYADGDTPVPLSISKTTILPLDLSLERAIDRDGVVVPVRVYWKLPKTAVKLSFESGTKDESVITAFENVRDLLLSVRSAEEERGSYLDSIRGPASGLDRPPI